MAKRLKEQSDAELQALIISSEADAAAAKANAEKVTAEAKQILANREKHNTWVRGITYFTNHLLEGIATMGPEKPRVEVGISSNITTETYIHKTRGYQKIVDAISEKFNVTIKIEYDDGGSDAGGWGSPMPSSKAIITAGKTPDPEAENATIASLLKTIEEA